uniref:Uncharacterized protein n=1 Tax=Lactuca sativa TaxID=4236 RepID=A0A9R1XKP6_LACSA|nr:hypothetical protein LSAT_V11C300102130 [Lactuca sativa]
MNQIESEFVLNPLCIPSTPQGVGKTTLIARVLENLRTSYLNLKIQGFFTHSIRWPIVGRYRVDDKEDTNLFVIDEVGKMELFSSLFFPAMLRVLESRKINLRWLFLPPVNRRER